MGIVYLVQDEHLVGMINAKTGFPRFKIGMSISNHTNRLESYGRNRRELRVLYYKYVKDDDEYWYENDLIANKSYTGEKYKERDLEKEIIKSLNRNPFVTLYKKNEWFEGEEKIFKDLFNKIIKRETSISNEKKYNNYKANREKIKANVSFEEKQDYFIFDIIDILFDWNESDAICDDIIEDIDCFLKLAKEKKETPQGWKRKVHIYEMRMVEWEDKKQTKSLHLNAQKE